MFVNVETICPVVLEVVCPVRLSRGQYLHTLGRLQGCAEMYVSCSVSVLVEARTSWSDRFLLRLSPEIILDS